MQKIIIHPVVGKVTLSRTRRSTRISLSVKPDGSVRLSFPLWVTGKRALNFLKEKQDWITATRQKMSERLAETRSPHWPSNENQITDIKKVTESLRVEAKTKLHPMVERLAQKHGFQYGTVRIKATKSRWGSCNARNDINLSLFLVTLPEHLAEYVVLHELCHTVHHNHSARFHALLDCVTYGRSKILNRELRAYRPAVNLSNAAK